MIAVPIYDMIILPGVVTGLAWTAAGGEILFIETMFTKGSGKIQVTGQLGDVMKESVQIAVSLIKAMHPESAELWKENDLHVHVPAGISKVFIPYENVEDLDDVAEEVKEKLEIIPVKKVEDVLKRLKL